MTQLRRRRETLPARAERAEAEATLSTLGADRAEIAGRRDALARDQKRIDDEVALTRDRSAMADKALYGGSVNNPRELQAFQDEIASLARRIADLEDRELELMVEIEPLDEQLATIGEQTEVATARTERALVEITTGEAEIDGELEAEAATRETAASDVGADLLAIYERLRAISQGVGIARLVGGTCGGCHLKLSAVELDRIRGVDPDELVYCEECGRLLAR